MSSNLTALVAALEAIDNQEHELTLRESEKHLRRAVRKFTLEQNEGLPSSRKVSIFSTDEVVTRHINANLTAEDPRDWMFGAAREVAHFMDYALTAAGKPVHQDLLPVGHPDSKNPKLEGFTASGVRSAVARWHSDDARVDDSVRSVVFAAFASEPGTVDNQFAVARMRAVTAGLIPSELIIKPIVAAFGVGNPFAGNNSSIARSARAKMQRRDRKGRFAEMGGGARLFAILDGIVESITGKFAGNPENSNDMEVEITGHPTIPNGIYTVPASRLEGVRAVLGDKALSKLKGGKGSFGPAQRKLAVPMADLLATRKDAPTGWNANGDGSFTSADGYNVTPDGKGGWDIKDESGAVIGNAPDWANVQKMAAQNDEKSGKAPKPKARLNKKTADKVETEGFAQEAGSGFTRDDFFKSEFQGSESYEIDPEGINGDSYLTILQNPTNGKWDVVTEINGLIDENRDHRLEDTDSFDSLDDAFDFAIKRADDFKKNGSGEFLYNDWVDNGLTQAPGGDGVTIDDFVTDEDYPGTLMTPDTDEFADYAVDIIPARNQPGKYVVTRYASNPTTGDWEEMPMEPMELERAKRFAVEEANRLKDPEARAQLIEDYDQDRGLEQAPGGNYDPVADGRSQVDIDNLAEFLRDSGGNGSDYLAQGKQDGTDAEMRADFADSGLSPEEVDAAVAAYEAEVRSLADTYVEEMGGPRWSIGLPEYADTDSMHNDAKAAMKSLAKGKKGFAQEPGDGFVRIPAPKNQTVEEVQSALMQSIAKQTGRPLEEIVNNPNFQDSTNRIAKTNLGRSQQEYDGIARELAKDAGMDFPGASEGFVRVPGRTAMPEGLAEHEFNGPEGEDYTSPDGRIKISQRLDTEYKDDGAKRVDYEDLEVSVDGKRVGSVSRNKGESSSEFRKRAADLAQAGIDNPNYAADKEAERQARIKASEDFRNSPEQIAKREADRKAAAEKLATKEAARKAADTDGLLNRVDEFAKNVFDDRSTSYSDERGGDMEFVVNPTEDYDGRPVIDWTLLDDQGDIIAEGRANESFDEKDVASDIRDGINSYLDKKSAGDQGFAQAPGSDREVSDLNSLTKQIEDAEIEWSGGLMEDGYSGQEIQDFMDQGGDPSVTAQIIIDAEKSGDTEELRGFLDDIKSGKTPRIYRASEDILQDALDRIEGKGGFAQAPGDSDSNIIPGEPSGPEDRVAQGYAFLTKEDSKPTYGGGERTRWTASEDANGEVAQVTKQVEKDGTTRYYANSYSYERSDNSWNDVASEGPFDNALDAFESASSMRESESNGWNPEMASEWDDENAGLAQAPGSGSKNEFERIYSDLAAMGMTESDILRDFGSGEGSSRLRQLAELMMWANTNNRGGSHLRSLAKNAFEYQNSRENTKKYDALKNLANKYAADLDAEQFRNGWNSQLERDISDELNEAGSDWASDNDYTPDETEELFGTGRLGSNTEDMDVIERAALSGDTAELRELIADLNEAAKNDSAYASTIPTLERIANTIEGNNNQGGFAQAPGAMDDAATPAQYDFVKSVLDKQGSKLPVELRDAMEEVLANRSATKGEIGAIIGEMNKNIDPTIPSDRQLASIRRGLVSKGLPADEAAAILKRLPKMKKAEASDLITRLKGMKDTNGWKDASPDLIKTNSENLDMRYTPKADGTWDVVPVGPGGEELGESENFKTLAAAEDAVDGINLADLPGQDDVEGFAQEAAPALNVDMEHGSDISNWKSRGVDSTGGTYYKSPDGRIEIYDKSDYADDGYGFAIGATVDGKDLDFKALNEDSDVNYLLANLAERYGANSEGLTKEDLEYILDTVKDLHEGGGGFAQKPGGPERVTLSDDFGDRGSWKAGEKGSNALLTYKSSDGRVQVDYIPDGDVSDDGVPIDASYFEISVDGVKVGETGASGALQYEFRGDYGNPQEYIEPSDWIEEIENIANGDYGQGFNQRAGGSDMSSVNRVKDLLDGPRDQAAAREIESIIDSAPGGFQQRAEDGVRSNGDKADEEARSTKDVFDWAQGWVNFSIKEGENRLEKWWKYTEEYAQWQLEEDPGWAVSKGYVDVYALRDALDGRGWSDNGDGSFTYNSADTFRTMDSRSKEPTLSITPRKREDGNFDYDIVGGDGELIDTIENVGPLSSADELEFAEQEDGTTFNSELRQIGYEVSGQDSNYDNLFKSGGGFYQAPGGDSRAQEDAFFEYYDRAQKVADDNDVEIYQVQSFREIFDEAYRLGALSRGEEVTSRDSERAALEYFDRIQEYADRKGIENIYQVQNFRQIFDEGYEIGSGKREAESKAPVEKPLSAKQMEPATNAQYDLLKEYADERDSGDANLDTAIQEALANRNLTKAQMGSLINGMRDKEFKPGVDPTKPTDRLVKSLNDKLMTKDITPEERKDILDRLPGMKRDEMEALNNKLRSKKDIPGTEGFAQEAGGSDEDRAQLEQDRYNEQMGYEPISRSDEFPGGLRDERTGRVNSPEYLEPDEARINDLANRLDAVMKDADFNIWGDYSSGKDMRDDFNDARFTDVGTKFERAGRLDQVADDLKSKKADPELVSDLRQAAEDIRNSQKSKFPLEAAQYDDSGDLRDTDLYTLSEEPNAIRKIYFEDDVEELTDNVFFNGNYYGDVRSGGAEGRVDEEPNENGMYSASLTLPNDNVTREYETRDEAVEWLAGEIANHNGRLSSPFKDPNYSFTSDVDLESEMKKAQENGTQGEFIQRVRDLATALEQSRGDRSVVRSLEEYADRAETNLGSAGKEGGFAQEAGTATPSPKMGEPATDAQYDYLKELANSKQGITPEMATAIQDALSSKNLTKSQMGAFLGQLRAMENRAGVDPTKPTPRQVQRAKALANSLGLSPAEKRALGLNRLTSMSSDEIQKLIDNLKRRGGDQGGSGGVRPKAPSGDKPGGGFGQQAGGPTTFSDLRSAIGSSTTDTADGGEYDWPTGGFEQKAGGPKRNRILEALAIASTIMGLFDEKPAARKGKENVDTAGMFANDLRYVKDDLAAALDKFKNPKKGMDKFDAIVEFAKAVGDAGVAFRRAKSRWQRNNPKPRKGETVDVTPTARPAIAPKRLALPAAKQAELEQIKKTGKELDKQIELLGETFNISTTPPKGLPGTPADYVHPDGTRVWLISPDMQDKLDAMNQDGRDLPYAGFAQEAGIPKEPTERKGIERVRTGLIGDKKFKDKNGKTINPGDETFFANMYIFTDNDSGYEALDKASGIYFTLEGPPYYTSVKKMPMQYTGMSLADITGKEEDKDKYIFNVEGIYDIPTVNDDEEEIDSNGLTEDEYYEEFGTTDGWENETEQIDDKYIVIDSKEFDSAEPAEVEWYDGAPYGPLDLVVDNEKISEFEKQDSPSAQARNKKDAEFSAYNSARWAAEKAERAARKERAESAPKDNAVTVEDLTLEKGDTIDLKIEVNRDRLPDQYRYSERDEDGTGKLEYQGVTLATYTGRSEDENTGLYYSDHHIYVELDENENGESKYDFEERMSEEGGDEQFEPLTYDIVTPGYFFLSEADFVKGKQYGMEFDRFMTRKAPADDISELVKANAQETAALRDYTRRNSGRINKALRDGKKLSAEDAESVKQLDSIVGKSKLKREHQLYRGIFFPDGKTGGTEDESEAYKKLIDSLEVGNEVTDPGFLSTAEEFENTTVFSAPTHVLTGGPISGVGFTYFIKAPAGTTAYKVGSGVSKFNESEILLPRNTKFKVTNVQRDAKGKVLSVSLEVVGAPEDTAGFAQAAGDGKQLDLGSSSFNSPEALEGSLKESKWNDRDGGEFDWPTDGFTQRASKSKKRNRIKDAMSAADEALGKLGSTTGQKRVKAVGAFAKDLGKVKDDLGKAVEEFKNPNDGVSKFDAIVNFAKALVEAKSALDRVRSRWDRADTSKRKSTKRSAAKPKVDTRRLEEASRLIDDAATPLSPATIIFPGDSGFPKIPDQGMRPIPSFEYTPGFRPNDYSPRVNPRIDPRINPDIGLIMDPDDRLVRDLEVDSDPTDSPWFTKVNRDLLVGPNNASPTAPKTVEEAVSANAKAEADFLANMKKYLDANKGRQHMWTRGYKLSRGSDRFTDRVTEDNLPINPASGHVYSASNMFVLAEAAAERGYSDRRWMTYKQAEKMGATVREGEQGIQILTPTQTRLPDGRKVISMKPTWVFNAEQMENLGPDDAPKASGMDAGEALDFVLMRFNEAERARGRDGLDITEKQARDAVLDAPRWVDPRGSRKESLTLPDRSQYDSPAAYLQTLLHELTHAVGHQSRMARESNVKALNGDRSPEARRQLAMEELTAELGSAVLMRRLGVPFDADKHSEYVKSWVDAEKLSEADINKAFAEAQLAADYVLGNDVLPKWDNITTDYEKAPKGFRPNAGRTWNPDPKFGPDEAAPAVPAGTPGSEENPEIVGFAQAAASSRDGKKVVKDSQTAMDKVTAQIIDSLKDGKLPWRKPFKGIAGANMQRNPASKRIYTGFNQQILAIIQAERGYSDPRWMTYNQAQGMGGQVRKGEKGVFILVPMRMAKEDAVTGEDKSFVMFKAVAVFNAEQIDGLNLPTLESEAEGKQMAPLDAHEFIVERYKKAMEARTGKPVDITYRDMSDAESPHWSPATDKIVLPSQKQFNSPEDMFDTMAHEMVHSTGHGSRLDRTDLTKDYGNADGVARAKEELIAEIGAATIADMFGVETTLDNSTAYVRSWLERLQNHPEEVIQASREAQKAVDYLLGIDIGDWSPLNGYGPGNAVDTDNKEPKE